MNRFIIVSIFLVSLKSIFFGQDDNKIRHEFGTKIVSFTIPTQIYYSIADHRYFQFVTGIFYRVSKKRTSLRATVNYAENSTESFYVNGSQIGTLPGGTSNNKDFQISIGGQYHLMKSKELLYVFSDLYYRNFCSNGTLYLPEEEYFLAKSDQFGINLGLGSKIKLHEHVFISPEIYCDMFHSNTSIVEYPKYGHLQKKTFNSVNNIRPIARLFLTISF